MSRLAVVPLDFKTQGDGLAPYDAALYSRVLQYCEEKLTEVPDFTRFRKVYAVAEYEGDAILEIHGVTCTRLVNDVPVFRASGPRAKQATAMMAERLNSFMSDTGWRGDDAFIWIDKDEELEKQCPNRECSIEVFELKPSKRMLTKVR